MCTHTHTHIKLQFQITIILSTRSCKSFCTWKVSTTWKSMIQYEPTLIMQILFEAAELSYFCLENYNHIKILEQCSKGKDLHQSQFVFFCSSINPIDVSTTWLASSVPCSLSYREVGWQGAGNTNVSISWAHLVDDDVLPVNCKTK
jgi:hypothetical protein